MAQDTKSQAFPDYFEKLLGYRSWIYDGSYLTGFAHRNKWTPGSPTTAHCPKTTRLLCPHCNEESIDHPAPQSKCGCGLYSFKDPISYMRQLQGSEFKSRLRSHNNVIHGIVKSWGRIIEHRSGYRAEFSEPVLLCTRHQKLCDLYKTEQFNGSFLDLIQQLGPTTTL